MVPNATKGKPIGAPFCEGLPILKPCHKGTSVAHEKLSIHETPDSLFIGRAPCLR